MIRRMGPRKICSLKTLTTELEDLQRAQSTAAEEHERIMRGHRLQIEELASKISEQEKARYVEEKAEAHDILALVKEQLDLQEAQETEQAELLEKHKEERVRLQEQCEKLQASLSRECGSRLEPEKEAAEKIAELEERLKELEEDIDEKNDMVNTLAMSHMQAADEVEGVKTAILNSDFLETFRTADIGVKNLGALNYEGWYEVCGHKFKSQQKFSEWISKIDQKLRLQSFSPPLKTVPDGNGGKMKYAIDEDDEWLTELRHKFGPIVADAVGRAALEIENWNPSGRFIVKMPWDYRTNEKATMKTILQHLLEVLKGKVEEVKEKDRQLKALTTPTTSRKRGLDVNMDGERAKMRKG